MTSLQGRRLAMRPLTAPDAPALRKILAEPTVAAWWQEPDPAWPLDADPHTTRLTIDVGGQVAGMIQFYEEQEPAYRHASIDVFLSERHQHRGLGTEALTTLAEYLTAQRGHHRLTIDPAADNAAAVRCYEKVGFRRVGVMRAYWHDRARGSWRDGLLMELVT